MKLNKIIKVVVIVTLLLSLIKGKITTTFNLLMTLFFLLSLDCIKNKLNYPKYINILAYIFILSTQVLGEIFNFYEKVWYFDIIMHILSSYIISNIAVFLLKKINKISSRRLIIIFIISLSLAFSALWELTEFTIDRLFNKDMQKDTILTEITSIYLSDNRLTPKKEKINSIIVNNKDYMKEYGGYIDIGLYDTMEDMFSAVIGILLFILTNKKKLIT